jgi:imidazolonepropionase-like amidohydrolase
MIRMSVQALRLGVALAAWLAVQGGPALAQSPRVIAIRAAHVQLGDGRSVENGVILIEGKTIRAVGAGVEPPAGAEVIEHPGSASPGLIGLHGFSGSSGALRDTSRAVLAEAESAWAFAPGHFELAEALQAGITCLVLTPSPQALSGGTSSVVRTQGSGILRREAQLSLGFSNDALSSNRFPTSPAGALEELDRRFEEARGPFADARSGRLPVLLEVRSRADVQRAVDFATRHKLAGAIAGAAWAGELAPAIRATNLAVVCGPFSAGEERRNVRSAVALAEAGVPIAFGVDAPWKTPVQLRLSAAMAIREGLEPAAAWKALCATSATVAGVGDQVGRLERGLLADVVLWSGDPLDLSSRVQAVFVEGQRVWEESP